jgi:hypothetical protein
MMIYDKIDFLWFFYDFMMSGRSVLECGLLFQTIILSTFLFLGALAEKLENFDVGNS